LKANIKTVAQKAGVSIATVSRVLREYSGVREKTRKKVLKVIKEVNYEINAVARSLRQKKTNIIGVIVGNVLSQFYSTIVKSVEDTAIKSGYNVILCNGDENPKKELKYLKILRSNRVDGIIFTPTGKNAKYINFLEDSGTKVVLLDRVIDGVNCDAVLTDNTNGAYNAVKYLTEQGYRRIGILAGYIDRTTGRERLNGYLKAISEAGIKKEDNLIKIGNFKKESGINLMRELLESSNKPEAIFSSNIEMTLGALITIKKMKFQIPDDIGFIGYDDSDWALIMNPPLTVVGQPVYNLGSIATEMLIKKIEDKKLTMVHEPLIMTLNTKLIVRNSTKKITR